MSRMEDASCQENERPAVRAGSRGGLRARYFPTCPQSTGNPNTDDHPGARLSSARPAIANSFVGGISGLACGVDFRNPEPGITIRVNGSLAVIHPDVAAIIMLHQHRTTGSGFLNAAQEVKARYAILSNDVVAVVAFDIYVVFAKRDGRWSQQSFL